MTGEFKVSPYNSGDREWLHVPRIKRGQSTELYRPWQGQYRVLKKISDAAYRVHSDDGLRKRQVVQFNRLKPCSEPTNLSDVEVPTVCQAIVIS